MLTYASAAPEKTMECPVCEGTGQVPSERIKGPQLVHLFWNHYKIKFTAPMHIAMMTKLFNNGGFYVSRSELREGMEVPCSEGAMKVHICNIRKLLKNSPFEVESIRERGYRMIRTDHGQSGDFQLHKVYSGGRGFDYLSKGGADNPHHDFDGRPR